MRRLKAVTLQDPVMPVADGFLGSFIRIDGVQLRERNGHLPACQRICTSMSCSHDLPGPCAGPRRSALPERRNGVRGDTPRAEWETELAFQEVIPAIVCSSGPASTIASLWMRFPAQGPAWVFSSPCSQDSADGGAADLYTAGDFGFRIRIRRTEVRPAC